MADLRLIYGFHAVTARIRQNPDGVLEVYLQAQRKDPRMRDHLGSVFTGSVSSVTSFGLFISLDDLYVEGLVHISELGKDYFQFDAAKHQILGERTGQRYRLGDRVQVRVVKVDMESTKIDFVLHELIDTAGEGRSTGKKPASRKPPKGKVKAAKRHG